MNYFGIPIVTAMKYLAIICLFLLVVLTIYKYNKNEVYDGTLRYM
ncbi:hypothetical protein [Romboutsia sp.]